MLESRVPDNPTAPGVWGKINPAKDDIVFRERELQRSRINALRPFDQTLSNGGGQPIRVVVGKSGEKYIMQGNHRIYGAQIDGLQEVEAIVYTPEQWEALTGSPFTLHGTRQPKLRP